MRKRRRVAQALGGVKPGTVLDHYTSVYGVTKGAWRAAHFAQMAIVAIEYGPKWTALQFAEYWAVEERTAFNYRAEAVDVFGENWRDVLQLLVDEMNRAGVKAPGPAIKLVVSPM